MTCLIHLYQPPAFGNGCAHSASVKEKFLEHMNRCLSSSSWFQLLSSLLFCIELAHIRCLFECILLVEWRNRWQGIPGAKLAFGGKPLTGHSIPPQHLGLKLDEL